MAFPPQTKKPAPFGAKGASGSKGSAPKKAPPFGAKGAAGAKGKMPMKGGRGC